MEAAEFSHVRDVKNPFPCFLPTLATLQTIESAANDATLTFAIPDRLGAWPSVLVIDDDRGLMYLDTALGSLDEHVAPLRGRVAVLSC